VSAYACDFARSDGFAGFIRLELREDEGVAWYWTYLVGVPGVAGILAVRDHEVPLPRQRLEIRTEGLWAELVCETPGEHWTFGLEAFGLRLDAPEDALRPGGEIGDRVAVGLDLEWEVGPDGAPGGTVHGDVLVDRAQWTIEAAGWFSQEPNLRPSTTESVGQGRRFDEGDDGEVLERVIIPGVGERRLVRGARGVAWTPLVEG
jgi:hypothetical protein